MNKISIILFTSISLMSFSSQSKAASDCGSGQRGTVSYAMNNPDATVADKLFQADRILVVLSGNYHWRRNSSYDCTEKENDFTMDTLKKVLTGVPNDQSFHYYHGARNAENSVYTGMGNSSPTGSDSVMPIFARAVMVAHQMENPAEFIQFFIDRGESTKHMNPQGEPLSSLYLFNLVSPLSRYKIHDAAEMKKAIEVFAIIYGLENNLPLAEGRSIAEATLAFQNIEDTLKPLYGKYVRDDLDSPEATLRAEGHLGGITYQIHNRVSAKVDPASDATGHSPRVDNIPVGAIRPE